jgi:predicted dehydrogenase
VPGSVRIGVVGCGGVVQRAYMPQVERLRARGLAEVVTACDVAEARLVEVGRIQPEHAYHVLEIMLKALESGRDGQAKELTSTFTPPSFAEPDALVSADRVHDPSRRE